MSCTVIIGTQWGDEGKGKIVDYLAGSMDIVARYQGGANAGHTVVVGGDRFILHQIPSGILHHGVVCVIGNGVVLDPLAFFDEVRELESKGISVDGRIKISSHTHLILPYHKALDRVREGVLGDDRIGTTCRGIGPAYEDKAGRVGVRMVDLLDPDLLKKKVTENVAVKDLLLDHFGSAERLSAAEILDELMGYRERLLDYMEDTSLYLARSMEERKAVLAEGAQGTLLDVDHGTYPYVTSSNTTVGAAANGLGISPVWIERVIGVAKAYTTRVGRGPFPTEIESELGSRLRDLGGEFGSTTGRPRRCGWFDAPVVRYAVRLSGITELAVTKLDVLDEMEGIKIGTGYHHEGKFMVEFPANILDMDKLDPLYEETSGWAAATSGLTDAKGLPLEAIDYLKRIEELAVCPVRYVSTGVERDAIIDLWDAAESTEAEG
jgi:adenylosuccinate synthase